MNKNQTSLSQHHQLKNWNRNYFIDLNENPSSATLASSLFTRIRQNFELKTLKTNPKAFLGVSSSNLHHSSSPQSHLISNIKDSHILSPSDDLSKTKKSQNFTNIPPLTKIRVIKQNRNFKSYDFFGEKEKINDFRQMTTKTQLSEVARKKQNSGLKFERGVQKSKSLAKEDFLKTVTSCLEIRDTNSYILDILDKDEEEKLENFVNSGNFLEFQQTAQNKIRRIERVYSENFERGEYKGEGKEILMDLMKFLYQEILKLLKLFENFLKKNRNDPMPENENSLKNLRYSLVSNESANLLAGLEILMKIHSPYNSEHRIKLEEINEGYYKEFKVIFNHFLYETETQSFQTVLSKLDNTFKSFESIVEDLLNKNESLTNEVSSFQTLLSNNILINKLETKDLLDQKPKLSEFDEKSLKGNYLELISNYNDMMVKNVKRLTEENEELQKQLIQFRRTTINQDDSPRRKQAKKAKTTEKSTQVAYHDLTKIAKETATGIQRILKKSTVYYKFKDDDLLSIVDLVLSEKIISDYKEIHEKNKIYPLGQFLPSFFLSRMGNPEITNMILRDFVLNLRDNCEKNLRYSLFLELCGVDFDRAKNEIPPLFQEIEVKKFTGKKEFRKIFYSSSYSCKILLKAAYLLRYNPKIEENDPYSPLFPSANSDADMQKLKILTEILKEILTDEGITDNEIQEEILKNFQIFSTKIKLPTFASTGGILINQRKSSVNMNLAQNRRTSSMPSTEAMLKYDYFMKFLLDLFADEFQQKMEHFSILLKLMENSRNPGKVFIEDFRAVVMKIIGNVSNSMIGKLYEKFVELNFEKQIKNYSEISEILAKEILEMVRFDEFYISENPMKPSAKPQNLLIFAKRENDKPAEGIFIYNQNNPENYKSWNLLDKSKDIFTINNFNIVDSLCFVNLIYDYIREAIKENEDKNDSLYTYHEIWKKEFYKLPMFQGLRNLKKMSTMFLSWDRLDLIQKIQMNWNLIKLISDAMLIKSRKEV